MSALFVRLEVTWADHPKMTAAGLAGRGLHATVLCLAKRLETDGWVDRALLYEAGADGRLIDFLVSTEALTVDAAGRVRPHGWEFQPRPRHRPATPRWMRQAVFLRDGAACVFCGATEPLVLDHVIPYSKGGPDEVANLQVLCAPCNWRKGARIE